MKISISKIIIFTFVIFFLLVFWRGLKLGCDDDTKNLIGKKIPVIDDHSNAERENINISEEDLNIAKGDKVKFTIRCAPCRSEHKYLVNLSKEKKEIKIIVINFKDKKNNAINFLKELGNPYNFVGKDSEGKISILFGIYGIPESILVDNNLTVIKKIVGPIDQIQYDEILKLTQ